MRFTYTALDADRRECEGTVDAGSESEAVKQIEAGGLFPTRVILAREQPPESMGPPPPPPPPEKIPFEPGTDGNTTVKMSPPRPRMGRAPEPKALPTLGPSNPVKPLPKIDPNAPRATLSGLRRPDPSIAPEPEPEEEERPDRHMIKPKPKPPSAPRIAPKRPVKVTLAAVPPPVEAIPTGNRLCPWCGSPVALKTETCPKCKGRMWERVARGSPIRILGRKAIQHVF